MEIQAIEEQTGAKLSKKSQEEEKHVGNEKLIAAISRIAISRLQLMKVVDQKLYEQLKL